MNRIVLLSGILVALVVVAWATGMFGGSASTVDLPDLGISGDAITRIDVNAGNEQVRARRLDSGEWRLEAPVDAPADTTTVMRLVRQVDDMELESIVSTNPDRFDRFEVDTAGMELTIEWGTRRLDLVVGKMGPDFQSRYVRLDGDNRVMLAKGVPNLSARLDQWRDKTLWTYPSGAVSSVSITREGETYGVARSASGWSLVTGSQEVAADSAEVQRFVDRLGSVKVDGFHTGLTPDSVLAAVTHQLRVEFVGGGIETLLMSSRNDDVAAVREGGTDVLKFFKHRLGTLTPALDDLVESPAP